MLHYSGFKFNKKTPQTKQKTNQPKPNQNKKLRNEAYEFLNAQNLKPKHINLKLVTVNYISHCKLLTS